MSRLEFRVPDIGEGLSEVEIVEWLVAPGDHVRADQPVVTIQTDKANVEIPSPVEGEIREVRGDTGDTLPVGGVLLILETEEPRSAPSTAGPVSPVTITDSPEYSAARPEHGSAASGDPEGAPQFAPTEHDVSLSETELRATKTGLRATEVQGGERRVLASPATRKLARDLGIGLESVAGTGPAGRVTREDVDAAARAAREPVPAPTPRPTAGPPTAGPHGEVVPLRGIRRQVARVMTQAWQQIPHVTELREIDATELVRAQRQLRARLEPAGVHLTFLPLFVMDLG